MQAAFSSVALEGAISAVTEAIEAASLGHGSWDQVCERLCDAFPGSSCVLISENPVEESLHHFTAFNIEQKEIDAYTEYFAFRNPWIEVFKHKPTEHCAVSERDYPSHLLKQTEFYNDFVLKIPNFTASTGLNLNLDVAQVLRLPLHYSAERAPLYDRPAEYVMKRLAGPLRRSVNAIQALHDNADSKLAAAALVGRGESLSFVVDMTMRLIDANEEGAAALTRGDFVQGRRGRISFADGHLTEQVSACVFDLGARPASAVSSLSHRDGTGHWLISFTRLPVTRLNPLLGGRQQILIQLRDIRPDRRRAPDLTEFARLFRLTPAEKTLCVMLAGGSTLSEAATALGVTPETTRQRVKSIFQKTGTHRQTELISMLRHF